MKLYIEHEERLPKDTLYTFLRRILQLNTNDLFHKGTVRATYLDPEFTNKQSSNNKTRSFDDLVLISKTYFKVSDKNVAKALIKLSEVKKNYIHFIICDSIDKWVFHSGTQKSKMFKYCGRYNNSHSKQDLSNKGKYCFNDIIKLAGLTKEDITI